MTGIRNILFVMMDQLRWDYLSCYGHPHLKTPNIDRIARHGVRFDRAFVQSPVCGPSRASFYTGRTVFSHGATWNRVPLPASEHTFDDYLSQADMRCAVVGKTHMVPDPDLWGRLGLSRASQIGARLAEPSFEPHARDDGIHPDPMIRDRPQIAYNAWLRARGYPGRNPWHDYANSALGAHGERLSGWSLRNSNRPARVAEAHSETAYTTDRAIDFITQNADNRWLLHLSYIKPHWPYMAPDPYHALYGPDSFLPVRRTRAELDDPHPVYKAFAGMEVSRTFSRPGVRETVLPAYMGLIRQIDDHLGRLWNVLEAHGLMSSTLIVITSDHGDYLGDHWLGEKEMFHDTAMRIPLIVSDPRPAANATRGTASRAMVEAIDLLPTFIEASGAPAAPHRLEGQSLVPLLNGHRPADWKDHAFCELDYAFYAAAEDLDIAPGAARAYALRTEEWKYIHFKGFRPQLFDLRNDPFEYRDLGADPALSHVRSEMQGRLLDRLTDRKNRITLPDSAVPSMRPHVSKSGVKIGKW